MVNLALESDIFEDTPRPELSLAPDPDIFEDTPGPGLNLVLPGFEPEVAKYAPVTTDVERDELLRLAKYNQLLREQYGHVLKQPWLIDLVNKPKVENS